MKKYIRYKALGFVEALLAIIVAGIASILLLGVAIDTIKQLAKNDQSDEMTQLAIEGGEMVRNIADKNNTSVVTLFPPISGNQNGCFELNADKTNPSFVSDGSGNLIQKCNYDSGGRDSCRASSELGVQYFRVFCITNQSDSASGLVVGKMVVGKAKCDDQKTCDVVDYIYYVLTKTVQK
jgi:hypothetical protein